MGRKYDSARRREAAARTRRDILRAALRLHREGITKYEPLAREAGCSVATVRKHFPNKEALFRNCTRAFAETLVPPDLEALGRIRDRGQRIEAGLTELCRIHEAMLGYAWLGAHERKQSPALDAEMAAYDRLTDTVASLVTPPASSRAPLIRGLLDFLTYRALRLSGELSAEQVRGELILTLTRLIPAHDAPPAH